MEEFGDDVGGGDCGLGGNFLDIRIGCKIAIEEDCETGVFREFVGDFEFFVESQGMFCRGQKLSELTKDIIRVDWSLSVRIGIEDFN